MKMKQLRGQKGKAMPEKLTSESWIARAKSIHGDKYDYNDVNFINARTPVLVNCRRCEHQWSTQPYSHAKPNLTGTGCPYCAGHHRTTEDFVRAAKKVHGDIYDLSEVNYKQARTKVTVGCPKHNRTWETTWSSFIISAHGCRQCGQERRRARPLSDFIEMFKSVHGDLYDYSLIKGWEGWHTALPIRCPRHPDDLFLQRPSVHYYKAGNCPKCAAEDRGKVSRSDTEEWIQKAQALHGNYYDYSQSKYTKERSDLVIICPKHGAFRQRAGHHLAGSGCGECHFENMEVDRAMPYAEFVQRANEMHLDRYSYPEKPAQFSLKKISLDITCPDHGAFNQNASNHMYGSGCPKCSQSKGEREVSRFLIDCGLEFDSQKRFPNCKDKRELPFDFYIPSINLLIEYDGEQHYQPRTDGFFAGRLEEIQRRDNIKNEFAKNAGVNLLRIKWDEDIISRLSETLHALG